MVDLTGELMFDLDCLLLQFRDFTIISDVGLLVCRELDDTLQVIDTATGSLANAHTGKHSRSKLPEPLSQLVRGQLAGYEDVNDAERLCCDPAMRRVRDLFIKDLYTASQKASRL